MTKLKSFKGEVIDSITVNESGMVIITCESGKFLATPSSIMITDDDLPFVDEVVETKKEEPKKEEVKKETPKEIKKETPKVEPPKEEFYTWEDLENMDKEQLIELITDEELDVDFEEIKSTTKLRKAVADEIGVTVPED